MGMLRKKVKVSNSKDPGRFFEEEFWVDTGALYSFVPEDCLQSIGVKPSVKQSLFLLTGDRTPDLLVSVTSTSRVSKVRSPVQ